MPVRPTRIKVNIPAKYNLGKMSGECTIVDISEGGIGIEANQVFVVGDIVRIRAVITKDFTLDMWGKVMNVSGMHIGIKYEEISHESKKKLLDYINDMIIKLNIARYENYNT